MSGKAQGKYLCYDNCHAGCVENRHSEMAAAHTAAGFEEAARLIDARAAEAFINRRDDEAKLCRTIGALMRDRAEVYRLAQKEHQRMAPNCAGPVPETRR